MEEEIDIEIEYLIFLVGQKPLLYEKTLKECHNRVIVTEAWGEVCLQPNPDFTTLEDMTKSDNKGCLFECGTVC